MLEAYRKLLNLLKVFESAERSDDQRSDSASSPSDGDERDTLIPDRLVPRLIICGHSAIDDPEGTTVYESVMGLLCSSRYRYLRRFVVVARIPPSDQLLNVLLHGARVALQLSLREGFEIKVTEALLAGVPVIAYASGGIPLQIKHGMTGYLVETGKTDAVAEHLRQLLTDQALYSAISHAAVADAHSALDRTPIGEAINLMFAGKRLMDMGSTLCPMKELWLRQQADLAATAEAAVSVGESASSPASPAAVKQAGQQDGFIATTSRAEPAAHSHTSSPPLLPTATSMVDRMAALSEAEPGPGSGGRSYPVGEPKVIAASGKFVGGDTAQNNLYRDHEADSASVVTNANSADLDSRSLSDHHIIPSHHDVSGRSAATMSPAQAAGRPGSYSPRDYGSRFAARARPVAFNKQLAEQLWRSHWDTL